MNITAYSFFMSMIYFSLSVILIHVLIKKDKFLISFSLYPLFLLIGLSVFRVLFSFEFSNIMIVHSTNIYNNIFNIYYSSFSVGDISIPVYAILTCVWIAGIIIEVLRRINGIRLFKLKLSEIKFEKNQRLDNILEKQLKNMRIKNDVTIFQSEVIAVPMIVGITSPVIYMPKIDLKDKELEYIVSHELTHFKSKDFLKKLALQFLRIIFWWNPFVNIFVKDVIHILELNCDINTVKTFDKRKKIIYLESIKKVLDNNLINEDEFLKSSFSYSNSYLLNDRNNNKIKQRFTLILKSEYKKKKNGFINVSISVLFVFIFITSYLFVLQPYYPVPEGEWLYCTKEIASI